VARKRLREYGLLVGVLPTGKVNAITDVEGGSVGHCTLRQGEGVRTGVTAILPHPGNLFREKVPAAVHVINGYGKTAGLVQVEELGTIESPILLTNTFSVPAVTQGALQYLMERDGGIGEEAGSINVVVAECNDSYLNDMRGLHVRPEHAREALRRAETGPVEEGSVGAGTGMVCFGWKGGIGTSSRRIPVGGDRYHIGVLVLSNFGKREDFHLLGVPVGRQLRGSPPEREADGSIIIVVATDLPMDAQQLRRLARRAVFGLARTGSFARHGSGDIVIAFSTGNRIPDIRDDGPPFYTLRRLPEDGELLSHCFQAVAEATEEAIYNSLFTAETTLGKKGRRVEALPVERVVKGWRRGRIAGH
jgi:D-aminopeptidase